ncbi:MAG: hypothetical protein GDA42_09315 [Ekhidna sp.]|nr:hypothetical protein [Ekhidna sp.]
MMERGKFEKDIKKKFKGRSVRVPDSVWDNIDTELNAGLLKLYSSKSNKYKWAAVAAIFITCCSLASQFFTFEFTGEQPPEDSGYNALLEYRYASPNVPNQTWLPVSPPIFKPVIIHKKDDALISDYSVALDDKKDESRSFLKIHEVAPKRYPEYRVTLNDDIYPYIQAPSNYESISKEKEDVDEPALWAGVEAGAGNFNSINSRSLTSSVDLIGLASAIGNDFFDPSTLVTPELNSGLATSIGIDLGMKLGQKWALETGISYTNVTSNGEASINILDTYTLNVPTDDPFSRETELVIRETYDHRVDVSSSTQFTSIPVQAGYFLLDRKMSLRLNVGFAANYFVTSSLRDGNGIIKGSFDNSFNQWSFDGIGGVEIGYAFFKDLDFVLEPNYRQAITPMTIGTGGNGRFIVQAGLKYKL